MALPSYVVKRDVVGDGDLENVVILNQTSTTELVLVWDYLDDLAKAQYDAISGSSNIVETLRNTTFRNQSLYDYLEYAIRNVEIAAGRIKKNKSSEDVLNDVYSGGKLSVGRYDINGSLSTYESTNVFSYLSAYGPSIRRDVIRKNNSGTVTPNSGKIRLSTGTTTGTTVTDDTVERGRYIPGKSAEGGAGVFVQSGTLTGDASITIGVGDDDNGAFFVITASGVSAKVLSGGVVVHNVTQDNFVFNTLNGEPSANDGRMVDYDYTSQGYIYIINYNWYGVGKVFFNIGKPVELDPVPLTAIPVHEYIPDNNALLPFVDPNLPVRVSVSNGTTTNDIIADIGGRRFDVLGQFLPELKPVRVVSAVTGLSTRSSLFGIRRKSDFPNTGRINSVPAYFNNYDINMTSTGLLRVYTVPRGTLTGTWVSLPEIINPSETALEYLEVNQDISAVTGRELLLGPFLIESSKNNSVSLSSEKGRRIPIIDDQEFVIEYAPDAAADGTLISEFTEEW